jgi:hypothetical protein
MSAPEHTHLSPDTIEEAVLGRLTAAEMTVVDEHVLACSRCAEAYAQEQFIAAGTRAWARRDLRQRLAGRLATTATHVPWPRVLGAAALLVVIVGAGLIYRWRETILPDAGTAADSTLVDATQITAQHVPVPAAASRDRASATTPTNTPQEAPRAPGKDASVPTSMGRPLLAEGTLEKKNDKEGASLPSTAAEERDDRTSAQPGMDVWLGGTTSADALGGASQMQPAGASQQGVRLNRAENSVRAKGELAAPPVFVIQQELRHILARRRIDEASGGIPTHVTQAGDTLYVTLYLDSLLSPGELHSLSARQLTPDSFQVILPDRVLGYRIQRHSTR